MDSAPATENETNETNSESEAELHHVLHREQREAKRLTNKPYIDHLEDAIIDGEFMLQPGKSVIIERYASILSNRPWLDTRSYLIVSINAVTGELRLKDDVGQTCVSNYITGPQLGYRFKVPEGERALPRRNKAAPKVSKAEKARVKAEKPDPLRRVYSTKGVIHTRIKGVAYVPEGPTKATDSDRLATKVIGTKLIVKHLEAGWEETWVINKDM